MERQRWTLLIHNIPPKPPYLRNKVAHRLAAIGAVALKNSVYLLPDSPTAREGFMWLAEEVEAGGGKAHVGEALFFGEQTETWIKNSFKTARDRDYLPLLSEAKKWREELELLSHKEEKIEEETIKTFRNVIDNIRKRADEIRRIDFFPAAHGQALVEQLAELASQLTALGQPEKEEKEEQPLLAENYQKKIWVTRSGIFVDRMASAWLILRFIDPDARFLFIDSWEYTAQEGQIRFDLPDAEFTHQGTACTFEVMVQRFGLHFAAMDKLAGIIHDLDLKSGEYLHPESAGIEMIFASIALSANNDEERIRRGCLLMDDLFKGASRFQARQDPPSKKIKNLVGTDKSVR